jgi:chromosome segregation ATPase
MTRAQQTYDRINELEARGITRAEAFKQLAAEYGQPVDSVRGAYYTARKLVTGEGGSSRSRRSRKRETTEQDAIEAAIESLEGSIEDIESEVEAADERRREAVAEHDALARNAGPRVAAIRAKIALLRGEAVGKEVRPARA